MSRTLLISFGPHVLKFSILDTPVADRWIERMSLRHQWPLDDPNRFYNFNNRLHEEQIASDMIKSCIKTINQYQPIIEREFTSVNDQDLMNYLHNIFERYHGMLDCQTGSFWVNAPPAVRKALADLNIAVHRCESLSDRLPRLVCTWFGQPKIHRLPLELQEKYGQLGCDFGGVYLNYVEIGKTARDLAHDNDQYIADEMFKPFDFYSSDFVVTFFQKSPADMNPVLESIDQYFDQHRAFFEARGINSSRDTRMLPLRFKVAQLDYEHRNLDAIMSLIQENQIITSVEID